MNTVKGIILALTFIFVGSTALADCIVADDAMFVTADGGCIDLATGKTWSRSISRGAGGTRYYSYAVSYCSNLVEGGYSDWRLPQIDELQLVNLHGSAGHLDVVQPLYSFWSITMKGKKSAYGTTGLYTTAATLYSTTSSIDAVCVR